MIYGNGVLTVFGGSVESLYFCEFSPIISLCEVCYFCCKIGRLHSLFFSRSRDIPQLMNSCHFSLAPEIFAHYIIFSPCQDSPQVQLMFLSRGKNS